MKSLLTPGICLVAVATLLHTGLVAPSATIIAYAFYTATIAGLLLAWRFHSSRIFFALLVLFLSQEAISYFSSSFTSGHVAAGAPGRMALAAVGLLLPLNFVLLSLRKERGFSFSSVAPPSLFLFVQSVIVGVLCRPESSAAVRALHHPAAGSAAVRHAAGLRRRGGTVAHTLSAVPQACRERTPLGPGGFVPRTLFWRHGANPHRLLRGRGFPPGRCHRRDFLHARLSRRTDDTAFPARFSRCPASTSAALLHRDGRHRPLQALQ